MTKHGNNIFEIVYLGSVVEEDIPSLPKASREQIKRAIEYRLTTDPVGLGKPLRYSFIGHRRVRVGDYRIIYRIDNQKKTVVVVAIKHRKNVYNE